MKTALRVGANVSPRLGEGEANGPGDNALVTAFLRAGAYRAAVTAKDSAGHLGLAVSPATLAPTAKLVDAGIARATLDSGKGAIVPIEITRDGEYRIELLGLKQKWRARLEDADGWPLAAPGEMQRVTRRFEKGVYRLVVLPRDVEARMVGATDADRRREGARRAWSASPALRQSAEAAMARAAGARCAARARCLALRALWRRRRSIFRSAKAWLARFSKARRRASAKSLRAGRSSRNCRQATIGSRREASPMTIASITRFRSTRRNCSPMRRARSSNRRRASIFRWRRTASSTFRASETSKQSAC